MTDEIPYQPYYCEENVWKLCHSGRVDRARSEVVFVTNTARACPHWNQRSGRRSGAPVFWDYHVFLIETPAGESPVVWDPESRLGPRAAFEAWWSATYRPDEDFPPAGWPEPRFRVVPAEKFHDVFSSNRAHMRDDNGDWRAPPPEWEPIYDPSVGTNLPRFLDLHDAWIGTVLDAPALAEQFRCPPSRRSDDDPAVR